MSDNLSAKEDIAEVTKFYQRTPYLVMRKVAEKQRKQPGKDFFDAVDEVLSDNSFSVFCSYFNRSFREMEREEIERDINCDAITTIARGSLGQEIRSLIVAVKQGLVARIDIALNRKFVPESMQDWGQIRIAETRAAYILERYAPRKIVNVLAATFERDKKSEFYLEEAKRRRLPALKKIIAMYLQDTENTFSPGQRSENPQPR